MVMRCQDCDILTPVKLHVVLVPLDTVQLVSTLLKVALKMDVFTHLVISEIMN